jgi:hypothetical protein
MSRSDSGVGALIPSHRKPRGGWFRWGRGLRRGLRGPHAARLARTMYAAAAHRNV